MKKQAMPVCKINIAKNKFLEQLKTSQTMKSIRENYGDDEAFLNEIQTYFKIFYEQAMEEIIQCQKQKD